MLTGKLVRVRQAKHKIIPLYINPRDAKLLQLAEQFLFAYRGAAGSTRGELEEELGDLTAEGSLIHQGLAKILEDRCEFEVVADIPPEKVRESVFRSAALARVDSGRGKPFDRAEILQQVAEEFDATAEQIDRCLFADLRDEQRILKFDDCTAEQLLHRYNVALAQAVLLRCSELEVRVWNETPARFRQLFRAVKFHRLIATIRPADGNSYTIFIDGPLSLFQSTQKYGLQMAMFLPTLLHCKTFELNATLRWGATKSERRFELSGSDGLRSHLPDFGVHTPREIENFADNFRKTVVDWILSDEPNPILVEGTTWVPDFKLLHTATGKEVYVEILGFWRKLSINEHYRRLHRAIPGQFVLVISEQYRTDEKDDLANAEGIYHFKRTPIAAEVANMAAKVSGVGVEKEKGRRRGGSTSAFATGESE